MKSLKSLVLFVMMSVVLTSTSAFASSMVSEETSLFINGVYLPENVIIKDRVTFIPLRVCSTTLGAQVQWLPKSKRITLSKGDVSMTFELGKNTYTVNGVANSCPAAPLIYLDTVYVPFRCLFETLGAQVSYQSYGDLGTYIHAVESASAFTKHLENLNSADLTTRRLAMMEAPRMDPLQGSTSATYLFPLNNRSKYFFVASSASDGNNLSLAYFEMDNGFAIKKWQCVKSRVNEDTGKHPILNYLGEGETVYQFGAFPKNVSNAYVGVRNISLPRAQYSVEYVQKLSPPSFYGFILDSNGTQPLPDTTAVTFHVTTTLKPNENIYVMAFDESAFVK